VRSQTEVLDAHHVAAYDARMVKQPDTSRWIQDERARLLSQVLALEDALVEAGVEPCAWVQLEGHAADSDYQRRVRWLETRLAELRDQALQVGLVPPAAEPGRPSAQMHGAPIDWLDRLATEQQARLAAEERAVRAEADKATAQARTAAAEEATQRVRAALNLLSGATPVESEDVGGAERPAMSIVAATRTVLTVLGPKQAVPAGEIAERVARLQGTDVNPATVRTALVRLRDHKADAAGLEIGHDQPRNLWWLVDREDRSWQPSRLQAVGAGGASRA
jgi:hypothetical protein